MAAAVKSRRTTGTKSGPKAYYGEKGWRFVRLWKTLMTVVEAEKPLTVPEINERASVDAELREFGGKLNTTRDDLWVLVRCGFPLALMDERGEEIDLAEYLEADASRRGRLKNTRWRLRSGSEIGMVENARQRRPTPAELSSLSLLSAMLRDHVSPSYPLYEQVRVLLDEFQHWLARHLRGADRSLMIERFVQTGKRLLKPGPQSQVLVRVAEALNRDVMLQGIYRDARGSRKSVHLLPLAAWFVEGKGQLFAARGGDGALRTYRLDRFESLAVDTKLQRANYDQKESERLLAGRFGGFIAEPERIILRAAPVIGYLFEEYQFHTSQKVRKQRDGSLRVTLECAVSFSLEEWILGFGENIEVIEPMSLRRSIQTRLKKALKNYGGD